MFHFKMSVAQQKPQSLFDTSYYESYTNKLTARFYFSKKYTNLTIEAPKGLPDLIYDPNTTLNMGIGATYKFFTLNLAYGFGFLNPESGKGKTRYLDLQCYLYNQKWTVDLFGEFYKGYYLAPPKNYYLPSDYNYYKRPDIRISMIGTAAYRNLNEKRFSFRASLVQTEWQKKSAGSALLGAEIFYGVTKGDSALVPVNFADQYNQRDISAVRFIVLGPGAGYAYTLVILQNFFMTGSVVVNADVEYSTESGDLIKANRFSFAPNLSYRFAMGYNSPNWSVNVTNIGNRVSIKGASSADRYILSTGNYRLIFAYRFSPGPKLRKMLTPIDRLSKEE
jgi:Domain of unknown function (DUF4421)